MLLLGSMKVLLFASLLAPVLVYASQARLDLESSSPAAELSQVQISEFLSLVFDETCEDICQPPILSATLDPILEPVLEISSKIEDAVDDSKKSPRDLKKKQVRFNQSNNKIHQYPRVRFVEPQPCVAKHDKNLSSPSKMAKKLKNLPEIVPLSSQDYNVESDLKAPIEKAVSLVYDLKFFGLWKEVHRDANLLEETMAAFNRAIVSLNERSSRLQVANETSSGDLSRRILKKMQKIEIEKEDLKEGILILEFIKKSVEKKESFEEFDAALTILYTKLFYKTK